jgi:hypothetical protein
MAQAFEKLQSSFDRFREAHFFLYADLFRYSLNAFLRAQKEVPQIITMEMQNEQGFPEWYRAKRKLIEAHPLIERLSKERDLVVHQGMLKPTSSGTIGITEGRGIKLGFNVPIDPLEDSDDAMRRILWATQENDFLMLLADEDEDSLPCVMREWRIPDFDIDLVELCGNAWLHVGELLSEVIHWAGDTVPPLSLDCLHSKDRVQIKMYKRATLHEWLDKMKASAVNS